MPHRLHQGRGSIRRHHDAAAPQLGHQRDRKCGNVDAAQLGVPLACGGKWSRHHGAGPPATKIPTIVLGTPGLKLQGTPAVFIPIGTPGVDHSGRIVRVDNVVSLPLKNLHRSTLPKAADILAAIELAI